MKQEITFAPIPFGMISVLVVILIGFLYGITTIDRNIYQLIKAARHDQMIENVENEGTLLLICIGFPMTLLLIMIGIGMNSWTASSGIQLKRRYIFKTRNYYFLIEDICFRPSSSTSVGS
ncbi:Oidioi.mRNA.OKI2018_I69.XSR.g14086.t1.cds [Oikopleura dioica]|uniref:Oidioi.mRNA.OKI2018_I69.XSR.g14086.t1.cds n=1 Tax=Oikopleura dioica TaxID=34765 RepID=A0ABN7S9B2_OIKDI|nr:Oidioi.mRNA.OKI2018_I69.XSR.g14086.t1.cds [Oikopleura dioica]